MLAQVLTLLLLTLVSLLSRTCHLSFTPFDWTFTGVLFLVCVSLRNLKRRKVLEGFPSSAAKLGWTKIWQVKKKVKLFLPSLRIPVQSGIFQALGLCLILEGVMSAVASTLDGLCFQLWFETNSSTTSVPASWLCSSTQPTCGWRNCCSTKAFLNDNRTKCSGI